MHIVRGIEIGAFYRTYCVRSVYVLGVLFVVYVLCNQHREREKQRETEWERSRDTDKQSER